MRPFVFKPLGPPFVRWMGPYTPGHGKHFGFRVRSGRLGTWVQSSEGNNFWPVRHCSGVRQLVEMVQRHWDGGRVLILPNGFVVKPLQGSEGTGIRALIGRCSGQIILSSPDDENFDLSNPGSVSPGDFWNGPNTTGLECAIQADGSLRCSWYHPAPYGRNTTCQVLRGPDPDLAKGFCAARPGTTGGRVRVTACGHVITNRQQNSGEWVPAYVGWIDPKEWTQWERWIAKEQV